MHSLKTARPLLTQVAYFVIFAIVLFSYALPFSICRVGSLIRYDSIIGVQSFGGSLRRTCVLQPTLGEGPIPIEQFCGGHIDPVTLKPTSFVLNNGFSIGTAKGYICPLGQICQVCDVS